MNILETDVLVIGAGAAGLSAAMAASSYGCRVVVLEKNAFPGGRATASAVGTICGLKYRSTSAEPEFAHLGFPRTFANAVQVASQTDFETTVSGLHYLPYRPQAFSEVSKRFLEESKAEIFYGTEVVESKKYQGRIVSVHALKDGQPITIHPTIVIDCSGASVLSGLLDLEEIRSSEYQSAAQVFELKNVRLHDAYSIDLAIQRAVMRTPPEEHLKAYVESLSTVPGSIRKGSMFLKMGLPDKVTDNEGEHRQLTERAVNLIPEVLTYLQSNLEAFADSTLESVAPETGFRVGKRPMGKAVLTGDEVMNCVKSRSAVSRGVWPIEIWKEGHKVEMTYFPENDAYHISLDHLRSGQLTNLFFAGRMISADDRAIASARVIGTCLATGYAAGMAAALKFRGKPEQGLITEIRTELFGT